MIANSDGNFSAAMPKHRVTRSQKNADNKQWYKQNIDFLDKRSFSQVGFNGYGLDTFDTNGVSEYKRMKVNYDLFNNIVNIRDFEYVIKPFGAQAGELPANFTNRDIISPKIKMLMGMEMKRPFSWKILAINEEATTRRETKEFELIREYVINSIVSPIRIELEQKALAETQGKELTPEQQQQIQQQIEQELQAMTPEEVKRYMAREHQDPAEALAHQLLEYLVQKEDIATKFNQGFKHLAIAAKEIFWVGVLNGEPAISVVNPLYFDYDKSPDLEFIEDGEWATCVYRLSPSKVIGYFGDQLSNDEIDKVYNYYTQMMNHVVDANFTFNVNKEDEGWTVRVVHCVWKALRKIGFLSYVDENGEVQERLVDEGYTLNREQGDISCKWEWIPEVYQGYKIGTDIYVNMGVSIGIPPEAEGQIGPNAAVTNTKQALVQSSHVLEPIFDLHNHVKKNVLQKLIDTAKYAYSENPNLKLYYILDDFSRRLLDIDVDLLENSTYGIFISNSSKAHEAKELVAQLAHAAMQSQRIDLSDVIKVVRAEGVQEAEELLEASESKKREEMQREQMSQLEKQQQMQQEMIAHQKEMKLFDRETDMMKEKARTEREIQKQTIMSLGFSEDKDIDRDGKPDILEVAQHGLDAEIQQRKQDLDEKKFDHQKKLDLEKIKLQKEKEKDKNKKGN